MRNGLFGNVPCPPQSNSRLENDLLLSRLDALEVKFARVLKVLGAVAASLQNLESTVPKLHDQQETLRDAIENVIAPLAGEARRLRNQEVQFSMLDPVAISLIHVVDRASDDVEQARARESTSTSKLAAEPWRTVLASRHADKVTLLEILERMGYQRFVDPPGTEFSGSRHEHVQFNGTRDPKKIGTISRALRAGFRRRLDGSTVRPEWVEVWLDAERTQ